MNTRYSRDDEILNRISDEMSGDELESIINSAKNIREGKTLPNVFGRGDKIRTCGLYVPNRKILVK